MALWEGNCRCGKGDLVPPHQHYAHCPAYSAEGIHRITLTPSEEAKTQYIEKVVKGERPPTPSREYLVALGFLTYINPGLKPNFDHVKMLEDIIRSEGDHYNG